MEYLPCTIIQVIKEGGIKNRKVDIQKIICYIKGMLEALAYLDVRFSLNRMEEFAIGI